MYYRNIFGNAGDFAYLKLPSITRTVTQQKLEFYYLITSPVRGSFSLESAEHNVVWETRVLTPEMDGIWTYGCLDVEPATSAEEGLIILLNDFFIYLILSRIGTQLYHS